MGRRRYAVIVAGGRGVRMKSGTPKQFLEIDGKPILRHTVENFLALAPRPEIIIVLPTDLKERWIQYCRQTGFIERYTLPSGGLTRFHSVRNALEYVSDGSLVAVHDGVRPFAGSSFLERMYAEAEEKEALIPVYPVTDSLRETTGDGGSLSVDRSRFVTVQTPQIFHSEVLKDAYGKAYRTTFTDDASVVESAGYRIELTLGEKYNIKMTTPEDLPVAAAICAASGR